jgi:hypothetical protein
LKIGCQFSISRAMAALGYSFGETGAQQFGARYPVAHKT